MSSSSLVRNVHIMNDEFADGAERSDLKICMSACLLELTFHLLRVAVVLK